MNDQQIHGISEAALQITATVTNNVDGDTVRVEFNHSEQVYSESLRILALDTEEVSRGSKPVTKMGKRASERAKQLLKVGDEISLTFPGPESLDIALTKYRGNFGRLLVYITTADGHDFQETMIREGYSPYFTKYGQAHFSNRHERYIEAERAAQIANLGIWDQLENNGAMLRNYSSLGVWWSLRGRLIEDYRELKRSQPDIEIYNTRLDYEILQKRAEQKLESTVFMELRSFRPVAGDHMLLSTGSDEQPFMLFVPWGNTERGAEVMNLLTTRYIADGEDNPRRSYAYVKGPTKIYPEGSGRPEIIVTSPDQIMDWPE